MFRIRGNTPILVVTAGVALAVLGLVMQSFADTAGLYCFTVGVVLILIFIGIKTMELGRD
ncbi:MAG: hypothetical protein WA996_25560 [Candidatus Promineifilaceae bacterium]